MTTDDPRDLFAIRVWLRWFLAVAVILAVTSGSSFTGTGAGRRPGGRRVRACAARA